MPFNFIENKRYSIDYINFFEYLNTHRFIRNTNIQRTFLEHWIEALFDADILTDNDHATEHLIYQHPFYYGEIEFYIHIDVSNILLRNITFEKLTLSSFTDESTNIYFDTSVNSPLAISDEIILCEFPRSDTEYIVVSGHMKLSQLIDNNQEFIHVIMINSQELLDNNLFCSKFDKYYYQFTLELNKIFQKYGKLKFNELHLLKKSFLNQTKYKFN